ncbi:hypothetical protein BRADI_3g23260v3 [Brachypodium distachyon]|uniref:Uncharacterized protein n=1 Tax=Brachypodium distachyon TaxID=15368 RepID=I1I3M6_BRADI|nr:hypothetical protein BRADI_3g23260v3 [Brachypodium distachyon]
MVFANHLSTSFFLNLNSQMDVSHVPLPTLKSIRPWLWLTPCLVFPWLSVNFFLKDGIGASAASLQILQASPNLPMVAKLLLGLLSDVVPVRGYRRLPMVPSPTKIEGASSHLSCEPPLLQPLSVSIMYHVIFIFDPSCTMILEYNVTFYFGSIMYHDFVLLFWSTM